MKTSHLRSAAILFLLFVMCWRPAQVLAAPTSCSFSKNVTAMGSSYFVSSKRAHGCGVQVIDITLQRNGKKYVHYRSDVDYLAYSAVAADLTGDGDAELVVMSKNALKPGGETVDVYRFEDNTLKRSSLPPLEDVTGYRGGDSFWVDGKQLVRNFPLSGEGNTQRGTRTLKYEMINNALALYVQSDTPAPAVEIPVSAPAVSPDAAAMAPPAVEKKTSATSINGIVVGDASIIIKTAEPVGNFKTMKLEKPERIAIDFPKGKSSLTVTSVAVDKFGITRVRVGQNKGFIRVVLDTKAKKFPGYTVKTVGDGVMVEFAENKP